MVISKKIKRKYYIKYTGIILVILSYIVFFGIVITQFIFKDFLSVFESLFILLLIIDLILVYYYYKKCNLPDINSNDILLGYLKYFSSSNFSDLEYAESINWFASLIRTAHNKRSSYANDFLSKNINDLFLILRPFNKNLCEATNRKSAFIHLSSKMLKQEDISKDILNFDKLEIEKYHIFSFTVDTGLLAYMIIILFHICGCFFIAYDNSLFDLICFFGNLFLCIPTDIVAILVYKGILRDVNKDRN